MSFRDYYLAKKLENLQPNLFFPFGNSYTSFTNNNLYSFVGKLTLNLQGKLEIHGFDILNKF